MSAFQISDEQAAQFEADGYLFVPKLLDDEETHLLYGIAKADQAMLERSRQGHGRDTEGKAISILSTMSFARISIAPLSARAV